MRRPFIWLGSACMVACAFILFLSCSSQSSSSFSEEDPASYEIPLGLPPIPWPKNNPYTPEKAHLGRLLYFDKRLSADGTVACASCHNVTRAFTDRNRFSLGIHGRIGSRHSPSVINSAYNQSQFWDGRAHTLEEQALGPIANTKEMASDKDQWIAYERCIEKIRAIPGYRPLFYQAFGHEECTLIDIAKAIATFERTILSGNSPYDRYQAGDESALTTQQKKGMDLFFNVGCASCHGGPLFTDGSFANIGIGMDKPKPDLGRYEVTDDPKDWGAFKVPTLRDIKNTYPYMHDGSLKTLAQVVDYYDKGGTPNSNLSPLMVPLNLSKDEKEALIAFLEALSGEGWQHFAAPDCFPE